MSENEVYIGIDFGTSFSKICYRVEGDLHVYMQNNTPFIPTQVFFSKDTNNVCFYKTKEDFLCAKYFKYSMAFEPIKNQQIIKNLPSGYTYEDLNKYFSIYFLACIIKKVKHYIIEKHFPRILESDIDWEINMSAPINNYYGDIFNLYNNVLAAASILSKQNIIQGYSIDKIEKLYESEVNTDSSNKDIYVHPELFVQAVYFTDPKTIEFGHKIGSYMIMDIGGGTVDIGIFWRRGWGDDVKFDLTVANILNYGVEVIREDLESNGISENNVQEFFQNNFRNELTDKYSSIFTLNINKMIEEEERIPRVDIEDISNKRIYYSGGGSLFPWFKKRIDSITKNIITEDKISIDIRPKDYRSDKDLHRLIIAMVLSQPYEAIERHMGTTVIINGNRIIPGKTNPNFEVQKSEIKRPSGINTSPFTREVNGIPENPSWDTND